ncbi:hypothetical protein ABLN87_14345 [Ruegeria sp. SCPT10]|uniref:hypothetical protein n=1 Tax=Ruegeria sp. SCP10 TaxID=3141377 RepID=UPI003339DB3E
MRTADTIHVEKPDLMWCAVIVLLAVVLFFAATPWGIGVRPDSASYLGFPFYFQGHSPGYIWAIDIVESLGMGPLTAATVVNLSFLCLNALMTFALARGLGASRLIAGFAALLIVTSPLVFELHVTVLSEGMFIFLMLLTLALLSIYAGTGAVRFLILAGLVSVLVFLTRFNGAPIWVVGVLTPLFLGPQDMKPRLLHAVAFLAAVIAPLMLWSYIESAAGGSGLGREFAFLGNATWAILIQGANSIWVSFFPNVVPDVLKIAVSLVLIGLLIWIVWHETMTRVVTRAPDANNRCAAFPMLATVYIFGHFALLLLSILIEPNLPLKPSYFAPVYVLLIIMGAHYCARFVMGDGLQRWTGLTLIGLGAMVLISNIARTGNLITEFREEGIFFAGPKWYQSPLAAEINKLDPETFVYSNAPDVVHLVTGYKTTWLPMKFNRRTGFEIPERPYAKTLGEMREGLANGTAVVAYFDDVTWRFYLPTQDELAQELNLTEVIRTTDGTLLNTLGN